MGLDIHNKLLEVEFLAKLVTLTTMSKDDENNKSELLNEDRMA